MRADVGRVTPRLDSRLAALGRLAETFDAEVNANAGQAWTAQQVRGSSVYLYAGETVSAIEAILQAAPATPANLTAGRLVLFDSTGRKWAITADCSATFQATLDRKNVAVATVYDGASYGAGAQLKVLNSGLYYVCAWFDGTSMPSLLRGNGVNGVSTATSGKPVSHVLQSGQASVPDAATLVVSQTPVYFALCP